MPKGIYKRSKETLERIKTQGFKKNKAPWNKGKKTGIIPKTAFKKGHKVSQKIREKMRIARKGHNVSTKTREKISKSKIGKKRMDISKENHFKWKGGRNINIKGYILIHNPSHPCRDCKNYVLEHRLVIEAQIGRYLTSKEVGHHINEIKDDNRPKNLMAFKSQSIHMCFHKNPLSVKSSDIIFDGRKVKSSSQML